MCELHINCAVLEERSQTAVRGFNYGHVALTDHSSHWNVMPPSYSPPTSTKPSPRYTRVKSHCLKRLCIFESIARGKVRGWHFSFKRKGTKVSQNLSKNKRRKSNTERPSWLCIYLSALWQQVKKIIIKKETLKMQTNLGPKQVGAKV